MNTGRIVIGLGFGDEGKGSIVDYLAREHEAEWVVRFNGGPQAEHRIVNGDKVHICSQIGAGVLAGVNTLLDKNVIVDPGAFLKELAALKKLGISDTQVRVHEKCILVTPFHRAQNMIKEILRGDKRHGSCARGIGACREDSIKNIVVRVCDIYNYNFRQLVYSIQELKRNMFANVKLPDTEAAAEARDLLTSTEHVERFCDEAQAFCGKISFSMNHSRLYSNKDIIFEGAHGVLLDEDYGFRPHNTWSNTTAKFAVEFCKTYGLTPRITGVTRAYMTRHGFGPLPTECTEAPKGDPANNYDKWRGDFRTGWLDIPLLTYSSYVTRYTGKALDGIALTCMDRIPDETQICPLYPDLQLELNMDHKYLDRLKDTKPLFQKVNKDELVSFVDAVAKVEIISNGPSAAEKVRKI